MQPSLVVAVFVPALLALDAVVLPEGEAKKTIEGACVTCHTLDIVVDKEWSREKWSGVVQAMVSRGAALKQSESAQVVEYLATHFGEKAVRRAGASKDQGRELVQDICSLCHELDRIKIQEWTREEWSEEIKGMISEGAPVTDDEFELIVNYLAKNFGPKEEK
jgi:mono/diheme cytochrome c family protein